MDAAPTAAWLRQGERIASTIKCDAFDKAAFKNSLAEIRKLSTDADPDIFVPRLTEICAKVGVAVVFEPEPPGCPVSGATKWLSPTKALLMLS